MQPKLNFDYTYITLFGRQIFEPMVIATNFLLLFLCIYCFKNLIKFQQSYPTQMAGFIITMGISSCFGAAAHAIHYQFGKTIFDVIFFISNILNLLSIYFFFRASYTYYCRNHGPVKKSVLTLVVVWIAILVIIAIFNNNFLLIKIHAGIVLIYALIVHLLDYRKNKERGSGFIVLGIVISFLSIIVHSFKLSIDEWFNYKDIAHVIMIISLIIIYRGIRQNCMRLYGGMQS